MLWTDTRRKLFALGVLILTTYVTSFGQGLEVSLPFVTTTGVMLASLLGGASILRFLGGSGWKNSLNVLSVPLALYVSLLALSFGIVSENSEFITSAIWAPLLGGTFFFSTRGIGDTSKRDEPCGNKLIAITAIWVVASPFLVFFYFMPNMGWFNPVFWAFCLITFWVFFSLQNRTGNFFERLVDAGCYNFLFHSGYLVFSYVSLVVSEQYVFKSWLIGAITAELIFPAILYLIALLIALGKNHHSEINLKNWHLVEGYLFLVAMVVAPPSIIDYIVGT